jgi:hypothetical protein
MKKKVIIIIALFSLAVLASIKVNTMSFANNSNKSVATVNSSTENKTVDVDEFKKKNKGLEENGITLKPEESSVKLSKEQGIEKAKKIVGNNFLQNNPETTTVLTNFTSKGNFPKNEKFVKFENVPSWIITFHNIQEAGHNGVYNADMNVVIDANTGEEILMYSHAIDGN